MSQTSGGEAVTPPSASLASDAMSFSLTTEGPHSAFSTPSSSIMHSTSAASDQNLVHSINDDLEDNRSCRLVPEVVGAESGNGNCSSGNSCRGSSELGTGRGVTSIDSQTHHQMASSKRHTVLNISPPPQDLFDDSLMSCQDEASRDSEQSSSIWMDDSLSNFSMMSTVSYNDNTEVPRKSRKRTPRQRPGPKAVPAVEASLDVFDADSAKGPHFVLSQLGPDNKTGSKGSSDVHQSANQKRGTLSMQFPHKSEGKELKILVQPETQHRARYLTEGSRGSVKDRSQQGFPTVKLEGVTEPVVLQVFVGNDNGRVRPHRFYQACRVTGRNTTACKEVDIDGTTVIEVPLDPSTKMTLAVDCVGILKLRNADVEARIGVAGSKKKSTRARLVFRVNIPRSDGSMLTLQTPSCQILCTQPAGLPEILKKSLHSCSVQGGEEVFIIGKNFLKDTKVIFQENISDDSSWKAEAEIDMELFHQNHLIAKVPPYQNQNITTVVHVGVYMMTNAGRSHDVQPFTYTPDLVKQDVLVKKEISSPVKTCTIDEPIKDGGLIPSRLPAVKREDVTPMEVSSNLQSSRQFKTPGLCPAQQSTDLAAGHLNPNRPFPTNLSQAGADQDNNQASVFTNTESLSTIHKQDIATTVSFSMPTDSLLQQSSQQFLMESREGLGQERPASGSGGVARLCVDPSPQQPELPLFQPDEVTQLEEAVRQLKAKGFCSLAMQSDNSMSEQQQQQHMQQQQPIQKQVQQQQMQQQQLQHQQQRQVLDNLQQQLFQPPIQMQCGLYQNVSQGKNIEQQASPQGVVSNPGSLFQQVQQQQQAPFFQQANNLLSIQTNFLQQTPSHPSPPIFHNPSPLTESQDPQGALFQKASQEQVQAALFQNNMSVLQSPEQQPSNPGLFLPQTSLPTQLTTSNSQQQQNQHQQQQLAFLNALQSPVAEPQSVFQTQNQLSPIQQISPLEQQQQQQPPQPQAQTQPPQQASLFHPSTNTLSPGQQQQQAGLLFCSNTLSSPDQASSLIFNSQGQMPPLTSSNLVTQESQNSAMLFSQSNMVTVNQQDRTEPMALGNPTHSQRQVLFQEQQPMQLGSSSASQQEQPVGLFMPQSNMSSLQGGLAQELAQSAMFGPQNSVANLQTTTSSSVQRPGTMFQTAVSGSLNPPSQPQQPGLFLFGLQNGCSQLMNTPGNIVSDQIIAISQSSQNQRENDVHIQNLLSQSLSQPRTVQNSMSGPQNMEKMDDLLVSLQESSNTLTRSYSLISQGGLPRD
ncbi:nuclear factor of activated T-cells 5 isoform X2 [Cynoglossus semilaevis]|nr:nuclear factor of activated T-cells 5 isoform X2 [Cynoglossus semilaevis]XP_024909307.1 nuclear factor of activated T-cells 5 isoform X2 [Cynoglossus semilaevis]